MEFIKGYEGLYSITEEGQVWSHTSNKFLSLSNKHGYFTVNLYKDKKYKTCYIHRLVAETFIPNPNSLPQVNHRDENKANNCVDNLEWCDQSYNINYGNRNKSFSQSIRCIETNKVYPSQHAAAKDLGVGQGSISYALKNNRAVKGYHLEVIS